MANSETKNRCEKVSIKLDNQTDFQAPYNENFQ